MPQLPVVVVGAGPVGLAAAAHLIEEGLDPVVLEAGDSVGASISAWGHVRLFSPWRFNIDAAAARLLGYVGWLVPDLDALPTGGQLVEDYLVPLSQVPQLRGRIRLGARATLIGRSVDKVSHDRDGAPFVVRFETASGEEQVQASSIIDASGTWLTPNPLGANGLPALGEHQHRGRLHYGIPDVLGEDRSVYAGKVTTVVGSGHSAANVVLALVALRHEDPNTTIHWLIRGSKIRAVGGGKADQLAARGQLGLDVADAVAEGSVRLHERFPVREVVEVRGALDLLSDTDRLSAVDHIVVATGQRPDRALTEELRLDLDGALDSTRALGPLIDPNVHSCGTVRPHSYQALVHRERGFFIAGAKSYGRAPTFLMATGYEQVRSLAAHLAGDEARAKRVNLVLPESGVCGSSTTGCGGSPGDLAPSAYPGGCTRRRGGCRRLLRLEPIVAEVV